MLFLFQTLNLSDIDTPQLFGNVLLEVKPNAPHRKHMDGVGRHVV